MQLASSDKNNALDDIFLSFIKKICCSQGEQQIFLN